ncbi:methionine ABC transporter ATP-binding protein [Corynebacterium urealyticum]|uniref:methionine ABC transporter ATP-binding protein n=1 Tax=Corynebacterium urealyticum TaxID=43771 RepID=UPI0002B3F6C0|nr:methionine ABC transporter ATP-binding protein [Corynebacterium urealyticum]AGE35998.1 methionine ABC transport system, ATP-binding protein [Corynebacterium urealyticum DSM 7111]QQB07691.1 methionine ABC transporter ATP-binding protein [Corynebacterium urealyticum]QQE50743.1 methionine ABC transporter ATP-binding protein [Corynebacterium urealyticum]TYR15466.1 methionine ABC transporter ATP-binding protein [Corynebacterium urealyticum]TYR17804.1 methionine ABC transporter ATP-binding protei
MAQGTSAAPDTAGPATLQGDRTGTGIEFRNVHKVFKQGRKSVTALEDVNITIQPGSIVGIIGYSGAGKSTLVRQINGLDKPTSGEILLDGQDIVPLKESEMRKLRSDIGMIFQQFNLFSSRTVAGNIAYPLKLQGMPKAEREARVAELLEFVGLADKGRSYPEQLSGGQKQRVGIARALATNPSLLLADEATSALDPSTTRDVLALLRRVNEELGITIVVITHEMEVVRSIADQVVVMSNARVVEQGSVYEVFSNPQTEVAKNFVATSLRNTPDNVEADALQAGDGRLFTITMNQGVGFFDAVSELSAADVSVNIVHGGVTTLQNHSFGRLTVRVTAQDAAGEAAIEKFYADLSQRTDIEEIR